MAARKRTSLRIEPYDPESPDADNDGIIQEGTAWERPAGTQLLDQMGRGLVRGATSGARPSGVQVVGRDGRVISYTPRYGSSRPVLPGGKIQKTPLAELGYPTLEERGLRNVGQISGKETTGAKLNEITRDLSSIVTPQQANQGQVKK